MNFAESAFLTDFSVTATKSGGGTVTGIFDNAYGDAFNGLVAGSGPVFRCLTSAGLARGNTLTINSVTYSIEWIEADGTGISLCRLEAQ